MKFFIVLSGSALKVRMIAVYRFLVSFLIREFFRLKNDRKNGTRDCAVLDKISEN